MIAVEILLIGLAIGFFCDAVAIVKLTDRIERLEQTTPQLGPDDLDTGSTAITITYPDGSFRVAHLDATLGDTRPDPIGPDVTRSERR